MSEIDLVLKVTNFSDKFSKKNDGFHTEDDYRRRKVEHQWNLASQSFADNQKDIAKVR